MKSWEIGLEVAEGKRASARPGRGTLQLGGSNRPTRPQSLGLPETHYVQPISSKFSPNANRTNFWGNEYADRRSRRKIIIAEKEKSEKGRWCSQLFLPDQMNHNYSESPVEMLSGFVEIISQWDCFNWSQIQLIPEIEVHQKKNPQEIARVAKKISVFIQSKQAEPYMGKLSNLFWHWRAKFG